MNFILRKRKEINLFLGNNNRITSGIKEVFLERFSFHPLLYGPKGMKWSESVAGLEFLCQG